MKNNYIFNYMKNDPVRILMIVLLLLLLTIIVIYAIIRPYITIPKHASTICKFYRIKNELEKYANEHSNLPKSLDKLQNLSIYDKTDTWNNWIRYKRLKPNSVLLISYGKDKKKGGYKDYAIMLTFQNYGILDEKSIPRQKVIIVDVNIDSGRLVQKLDSRSTGGKP